MERGDEFHWTIRTKKEPNRILGAIGLMRNREENRGFWLVPEAQGQGLMTTEGRQLFRDFLVGISEAEEARLVAGLRKIKANAERQLSGQ